MKDTLIVTGPRHSGKTFGVQQLESYWQQQPSRAVITLDLKSLDGLGDKMKMDRFFGLWQGVNDSYAPYCSSTSRPSSERHTTSASCALWCRTRQSRTPLTSRGGSTGGMPRTRPCSSDS